uniref:Uncharacterized protein n=1 Tax=Nannochloropsis gaditana (strain CCMP526) TaxID=1093141 RepID=I2CRC9_NANGC
MMEYFKRLPGLTTPAVVDLAHTIPLRRAQLQLYEAEFRETCAPLNVNI